jgi:hypothetical protein
MTVEPLFPVEKDIYSVPYPPLRGHKMLVANRFARSRSTGGGRLVIQSSSEMLLDILFKISYRLLAGGRNDYATRSSRMNQSFNSGRFRSYLTSLMHAEQKW